MRIGITGGIGSGKSEVTRYLRSLGERVICADEVSRQLAEPGGAGALAIRRAFGDSFFLENGALDRRRLAAEVFGDDEKLKTLNEAMHPLIIGRVEELASHDGDRVFIDAALLIQTGMHQTVDIIWLVVADLSERVARVVRRDGLPADEVRRRIKCQPRDEELEKYADALIRNDGGVAALQRRVDELLAQLNK